MKCLVSGNVLAQHLAQCDRQSAYPSEEQAKLNTVAVATTKHGMMDSLGLQRNKDIEDQSSQSQVEIKYTFKVC